MKTLSFYLVMIFGLALIGSPVSAQTSTEANLAIIVESNTYVPYFYRGRSEPSRGNNIRLVAIPSNLPTASSYQWEIGNQYFTTQAPYVTTKAPMITDDVLLKVTAFDNTGRSLASHQEYITLSDPEVLFYENSLLHGHSQNVLSDGTTMIGEEISLRAEPYFFGSQSLLSQNFGRWTTTNLIIDDSSNDWRIVNLIKPEGGSASERSAKVQLQIVPNNNNISQQVYGELMLNI